MRCCYGLLALFEFDFDAAWRALPPSFMLASKKRLLSCWRETEIGFWDATGGYYDYRCCYCRDGV